MRKYTKTTTIFKDDSKRIQVIDLDGRPIRTVTDNVIKETRSDGTVVTNTTVDVFIDNNYYDNKPTVISMKETNDKYDRLIERVACFTDGSYKKSLYIYDEKNRISETTVSYKHPKHVKSVYRYKYQYNNNSSYTNITASHQTNNGDFEVIWRKTFDGYSITFEDFIDNTVVNRNVNKIFDGREEDFNCKFKVHRKEDNDDHTASIKVIHQSDKNEVYVLGTMVSQKLFENHRLLYEFSISPENNGSFTEIYHDYYYEDGMWVHEVTKVEFNEHNTHRRFESEGELDLAHNNGIKLYKKKMYYNKDTNVFIRSFDTDGYTEEVVDGEFVKKYGDDIVYRDYHEGNNSIKEYYDVNSYGDRILIKRTSRNREENDATIIITETIEELTSLDSITNKFNYCN